LIEKILVYRLGSLGDTILALPCFRALRRAFPAARITVLTNAPVSGAAPALRVLLEPAGVVNNFLEYPVGIGASKKILKLHREIAGRDFDAVVNIAPARGMIRSLRDLLFFKACGIPRVIGTPVASRDLRPELVSPERYEWETHRLMRRIAAIAPVNLADETLWDLGLSAPEIEQADALLADCGIDEPFIALSVGSKVPLKDWGQEKWRSLLARLSAIDGMPPLLFCGGAEDRSRSEDLGQSWPGRAANIAGRCSPRITAAALRKASLFVGIDSGPMHLAGCMGVPCVAIFTARAFPGQWSPPGSDHNIIYHRTECFACELDECVSQRRKCITSITVTEVCEAVLRKLEHVRNSCRI
jgi:ADP-heptose:LPS heptosyltransferase